MKLDSEKLGLLIIYGAPFVFSAFWRVASMFAAPQTGLFDWIKHFFLFLISFQKIVAKVQFISSQEKEKLLEFIDEEVLEEEYGGKSTYKYNHEEYMKQMQQEEDQFSRMGWV